MAQTANPRRTSLVVPILLIMLGAIFLYSTWRPSFDPWPVLWTYWPLILIFLGIGKIWDNTRPKDSTAPSRFSAGSTVGIVAFVVVLMMLFWHGHAFSYGRGSHASYKHLHRTVDAAGAKSIRGSIDMSAGDLTVSGGTDYLLDGSFDYHDLAGIPEVEYRVTGSEGDLTISEGESSPRVVTTSSNDWNLRFGKSLPLDLKINVGAGQGRLRLRDLPIKRLDLNIGAGRVEADLTGPRQHDLDADIEGGVGEAVIRVPRDIGVIVNATGGLGAIDAHGLKQDGDEYTNEAYGHTPVTIRLKVQGGVGRIALILE